MSSLQSPSAPGEPSPMQADSFGQALAAERQAREQRTPDWPPWMAPAALVGGVVLSMVGVLIVERPAAAFGVDSTASHMPAGLTIADTVVQDSGFILVAVLCARMGGRTVRSWQFGLRRPRVGWWRASGLIFLPLLAFVVVSAIWSALVNPEKEKVLETLGSNAGTTLLLLSAALTCIVAPICEEFLFRGFIFTALRNWKGTWPAGMCEAVMSTPNAAAGSSTIRTPTIDRTTPPTSAAGAIHGGQSGVRCSLACRSAASACPNESACIGEGS